MKVLIYRYSGETDIAVGIPVAGRTHPDLDGQIGLFANTIVLRSQLDDAQSFASFLEQIRVCATAAYDHQDYPFDQLVQDLNPPRDPSRNPLFDIMLVLQNTANDSLQLPNLEISSLGLDYGLTQFDMLWNFAEAPNGLHLDLTYSTDLFKATTIEQLLEHWRVLVAAAVANPETPVGRLPLLRHEERAALLNHWSPPPTIEPSHQSLVQWFEAQVAATPHAIAITDGEHHLTYAGFNARANGIARQLRRRLGAVDTRSIPLVGLCLPRSIDLVVGILGILKAGAAYVPIDIDAPQARLRYIIQDSGASALLVRRDALDVAPELISAQKVVDIESVACRPGQSGARHPPRRCRLCDLYVRQHRANQKAWSCRIAT